jgi:hypothetical protein
MLWTLIGVLLVLWAFGLAFKVAASAIHILLVFCSSSRSFCSWSM